jgi:predicted  nucleic acid-binding Zn-ribbon protein
MKTLGWQCIGCNGGYRKLWDLPSVCVCGNNVFRRIDEVETTANAMYPTKANEDTRSDPVDNDPELWEDTVDDDYGGIYGEN